MSSNRISIFSFFSGAGFLDLGFEKNPAYAVDFVSEYHAPFLHVHRESRKSMNLAAPRYGYNDDDITLLASHKAVQIRNQMMMVREEGKLVGFIGGPPCPDFSVAGKNRGEAGENGKLSGIYIQMICEMLPDFFLFENVKGLWRTTKHRRFYEELKAKLQRSGYRITERLINALEFGVPQDRERIIMIGFRDKTLHQLEYSGDPNSYVLDFDWTHAMKFQHGQWRKANWPSTDDFATNSVLPSPANIPIELTVEYWFRKNDVERHPNSPHFFKPQAGAEKFKVIKEGDDKKKSYKRLHRWRYSPTAAYGNNEVHLHPYLPRRISAAEALAIQSLPKEFTIPSDVTLTNMFKTIGNGVPYLAAKGLADNIEGFLRLRTNKFYPDDYSADSPKPRKRYRTATEEQQLSVFEPKE